MMKNKVSCGTICYQDSTLQDALRGVSEAGFSYVDISSSKDTVEHVIAARMTEAETYSLKRHLRDYGLELITISGHTDLAHTEGVAHIKSCIDLAQEMQAEYVVTGPGEGGRPETVRQLYRNMEEIGQYAAERGVIIALENEGTKWSTGKEIAKLVRGIGLPAVRINYDTCNAIYFSDSETDLEEDLKYTLEYLVHVHLKDKIGGKAEFNFPALGDGYVDFEPLLRILMDKGYTGPFTVEIEHEKGIRVTTEYADKLVKRSHDFLDRLFSRLSR